MATLTVYPDSNAIDGYVGRHLVSEAWTTLTASAGTVKDDSSTFLYLTAIYSTTTTDEWSRLYRGIMLFDTSAIPDGATISAATLSLYYYTKGDILSITPSVNIYSSNPSSTTALANSDYGTLGTTAFSTAITYANWTSGQYNDFALNASGLAAISKTGLTKLGARNPEYDVADSSPTWTSSTLYSRIACYSSRQTGTTNDPKLVITYSGDTPDPFAKIDEVEYANLANVDGVTKANISNIY